MTIKEYLNSHHAQLDECRKRLRKLNDEFARSNTKFVCVGDILTRCSCTIVVDDIAADTSMYEDEYGDYFGEGLLYKEFNFYYDLPAIAFKGRICKKDGTIIGRGKTEIIVGESNLEIRRKNANGVYEHFKTLGNEDFRKELFGIL